MDVNDRTAGKSGATDAPTAAANRGAVGLPTTAAAEVWARQIGELEFLVGTSCSRAINLLMRPDRDPTQLADELAFLGERATRLAVLLRGSAVAGDGPVRADTGSVPTD
jgi:hypothetical protein